MLKEIGIGVLIIIGFLVFLYYASQVVMRAWIKTVEKYFKNKSKEKQNGKKTKK